MLGGGVRWWRGCADRNPAIYNGGLRCSSVVLWVCSMCARSMFFSTYYYTWYSTYLCMYVLCPTHGPWTCVDTGRCVETFLHGILHCSRQRRGLFSSSCNSNIHLIGVFATGQKHSNAKFGNCLAEPAAHMQMLFFLKSVLFSSRKSNAEIMWSRTEIIDSTKPVRTKVRKNACCGRRSNWVWTLLQAWRNDRYLRDRLVRVLSREIARTRFSIQT